GLEALLGIHFGRCRQRGPGIRSVRVGVLHLLEPPVAHERAKGETHRMTPQAMATVDQDARFPGGPGDHPVKSRMTRQVMATVDQDARFPGGPGRLSAIGLATSLSCQPYESCF